MRPRRTARADERGFTLLELLVAVALMAILAVLCWRGLESVLTSRDRITAASNEMRALSTAFTQIDEDLRRSWPVQLLKLEQPTISFLPGPRDDDPPMLVIIREGSAADAMRIQRVVYRLRDGVFERGFSPWQVSEFAGAVRLDELVWQPLIIGVQGMALRAWLPEKGWLAGAALVDWTSTSRQSAGAAASVAAQIAQQAQAAAAAAAAQGQTKGPSGVELTLNRQGYPLRRLFAVED
ncbi:MAG: prepilin-type N-terminal cleavage/methylation domain-containing protein [Burkholderiaceae bacterium]